MKAVVKDEVLNKLISLLSTHQKLKYKHRDAEAAMVTEERWVEIDRQIDKLNWLYGGHFMTNEIDRDLIKECCKLCNANENDFKSKNRKRELVYARGFYAKYLFLNGQSHDDIGYKVNCTRSNVYNMLSTVDDLIQTDKLMREKFQSLLSKFKIQEVDAL